jgi:hypothetical protein
MNQILKRVFPIFIVIAFHTVALTNCGEEALTKGAPVAFKITHVKNNVVLFETKDSDSAKEYESPCDNSLNLRVEMTLPAAEGSEKSSYNYVDFLLESRNNLQTSFKKSSINV